MSPKLINILLILASFVMYYVFIGPLWTGEGSVWVPERGGVKTLSASEAQYADTVNKANELFRQGQTFQKQYDAIGDDVKQKMMKMVPAKIDQAQLLSEVSNIANESGVALSNLSVTEAGAVDKVRGSYNVSFKVKTTYSKFKDFMRNYENSLRLFTLQSVSFESPEKIDDLIDFNVVLKTYYIK